MKIWGSLGCLAACGLAYGDRLIDIPIGRTISRDTVVLSLMEAGNEQGSRDRYLAFSPLQGIEIAARQRFRPNENGHTTFDLAYNLVNPVASVSPGISLGVLDAAGETVDGRRTYVAVTFRELLQVGEKGANGEATLGVQFGHLNTGFVGVSLPLWENFRLMTEHNGARISAGFEYEPTKGIKLRTVTQDGTLLFGLNLSRRF